MLMFKKSLFFIILISSSSIIFSNAVPADKFEKEFGEFIKNIYDTPPRASLLAPLTIPTSPSSTCAQVAQDDEYTCNWPNDEGSVERDLKDEREERVQQKKETPVKAAKQNKLQKKDSEHRLHVCTSVVHLPLANTNCVLETQESEPTDFADLFQRVTPACVMLVLIIEAKKMHTQEFDAAIKKLNQFIFNTALERKKAETNSQEIKAKLTSTLAPIVKFLTEKPATIKAISTVEFTDTARNALKIYSHKMQNPVENYHTLTILCDDIKEISPDNLRTVIGTAEMPTVLKPAKTAGLTPTHNASPKSPSLEETREHFKRDNVVHFLKTLQVTEDYCLSVFLKHPEVLKRTSATAAAKK